MATLFQKIISREIPAWIVAEDAENIAFLDINPLQEGHVLCVPKVENDYIFSLAQARYASLMEFARKVAPAIEKSVDCERIGMAVIGLEVPHTHVHLVPINSADDLNFTRPKLSPSAERQGELQRAISAEVRL